MKRNKLFIVFVLILLNNLFSLNSLEYCKRNSTNLNIGDIIGGVGRGLAYLNNNATIININVHFGVLLAYVQLINIGKYDEKLQKNLKIAETILNRRNLRSLDENMFQYNIWKHILKVRKWLYTISDNSLKLSCNDHFVDQNIYQTLKLKGLIEYLLSANTMPDEYYSDKCLSELTNKFYLSKQSSVCYISDNCNKIMKTEHSHGYSSTHRLLFWLACKAEGCIQCQENNFYAITKSLCCDISLEISLIEEAGFHPALSDLFMEEVVLCVLSGYKDVMNEKFIEKVIQWQMKSGCWNYENPEKYISHKYRIKNTRIHESDSCSLHATSLGVVFLTQALRKCYI